MDLGTSNFKMSSKVMSRSVAPIPIKLPITDPIYQPISVLVIFLSHISVSVPLPPVSAHH